MSHRGAARRDSSIIHARTFIRRAAQRQYWPAYRPRQRKGGRRNQKASSCPFAGRNIAGRSTGDIHQLALAMVCRARARVRSAGTQSIAAKPTRRAPGFRDGARKHDDIGITPPAHECELELFISVMSATGGEPSRSPMPYILRMAHDDAGVFISTIVRRY